MFGEDFDGFVKGLHDRMKPEEAKYANLSGLKLISAQAAIMPPTPGDESLEASDLKTCLAMLEGRKVSKEESEKEGL
eukprot:1549751-Amphidinium_carterae.1